MFLDTNVLAYTLDEDEPARREIARRLLGEAQGRQFVLSTQVLQELYWTLTRKLKRRYSPVEGETAVRSFLELPIVTVDTALILAAIQGAQTWRIDLWDALVVEAALRGGCSRLLTEDMQHGREFGRLVVENPFRAAS